MTVQHRHWNTRLADLNGDGRAEVIQTAGNGVTRVAPSLGSRFGREQHLNERSYGPSYLGDFSGDGRLDIVSINRRGETFKRLTNQTPFDLPSSFTTAPGATFEIEYQPSTNWQDNEPPVRQLVSRIVADDGRGNAMERVFTYQGLRFDRTRNRSLGFRYTKVTDFCGVGQNCPYTETWYRQSPRDGSLPERVIKRNGKGQLLEAVHYYYIDNDPNSSRYQLVESRRVISSFEPNSPDTVFHRVLDFCEQEDRQRSRYGGYVGVLGQRIPSSKPCKTAAYDRYGNVERVIESQQRVLPTGDTVIVGTARTHVTKPARPNTAYYLVSLPALSEVWAGEKLLTRTTYSYDNKKSHTLTPWKGLLTRKTEWSSHRGDLSTRYSHDVFGNVLMETDPRGAEHTTVYDEQFHLYPISTTNPVGHQTNIPWPEAWDNVCRLPTHQTKQRAGGSHGVTYVTTYDSLCRSQTSLSPKGNWTEAEYCVSSESADNSCGDAKEQHIATRKLGPKERIITTKTFLDGFARPYRTEVSDAEGNTIVREQEYTAQGQKLWESAPYYKREVSSAVTLHAPYYTLYQYDDRGRITADGRSQDTIWDPQDPRIQTQYSHSIIDGTTFATVTVWNELGSAWGDRTEPEQHAHHTVNYFDDRGNMVRRDRILEGRTLSTQYQYNLLDRLTAIEDAQGNRWRYVYDSLGLKMTEYNPDHGISTYSYDQAGRMLYRIDAKGQEPNSQASNIVRYRYDKIGRVLSQESASGFVIYGYDENTGPHHAGHFNLDQQTTACIPKESSCSTVTSCQAVCAKGNLAQLDWLAYRNYDDDGHLVQDDRIIDSETFSFSASYDPSGALLSQTFPDGDKIDYQYDGLGRVTTLPGLLYNASYAADGQLLGYYGGNGITHARFYDWQQRLQLSYSLPDHKGQFVQLQFYSYDDANRIIATSGAHNNDHWKYTYDHLGRLTDAINGEESYSETFQYDDIDNLVYSSRLGTITYGSAEPSYLDNPNVWRGPQPHAVRTVDGPKGVWNYRYDSTGNMIHRKGSPVTFDSLHRMTQHHEETMRYDDTGERIVYRRSNGKRTLYPRSDYEFSAGKSTKYFRLGGTLVAKRVRNIVPTYTFSFSRGFVAKYHQSYWFHTDARGSIQAVTDEERKIVQSVRYRPYGDEVVGNSEHEESHGYIGERRDPSGLSYLHARFYDPDIGRFINPDPSNPMDQGVGLNLYAYASNNPITLVDTAGLQSSSIVKRQQSGNFRTGQQGQTRPQRWVPKLEQFTWKTYMGETLDDQIFNGTVYVAEGLWSEIAEPVLDVVGLNFTDVADSGKLPLGAGVTAKN